MKIPALIAVLAVLLIAACAPSGEEAGSGDGSSGGADAAASGAADSHDGVHACDILTVDFIKEVLGTGDFTPEDQRVPNTGRSARTYSSCTVKWKSSKTREMVVMDRTLTVPDENNITLSISIFEPGKGQGVFDVGVNHLKERNDHEPIRGIGEEAMWFPAMRQISVRGNRNVFHLALRYPDGEGDPLEYAKTMAQAVLKKLE